MIMWLGGPQTRCACFEEEENFFLAGNRTLKDTFDSLVTARTDWNLTAWLLRGLTGILNAELFMIYRSKHKLEVI